MSSCLIGRLQSAPPGGMTSSSGFRRRWSRPPASPGESCRPWSPSREKQQARLPLQGTEVRAVRQMPVGQIPDADLANARYNLVADCGSLHSHLNKEPQCCPIRFIPPSSIFR